MVFWYNIRIICAIHEFINPENVEAEFEKKIVPFGNTDSKALQNVGKRNFFFVVKSSYSFCLAKVTPVN